MTVADLINQFVAATITQVYPAQGTSQCGVQKVKAVGKRGSADLKMLAN